jgi:CRP-like cAMP-binding protein
MQLYPVPENLLLRAASRANTPVVSGKLNHVTFESGQQLWAAGDVEPHAFFPLRGAVSLQLSPAPGKNIEIAMVGREGFAGVALVPASDTLRMSATAISAGEAFTMPREVFQDYLAVSEFRDGVERYSQFFLTILSRILVCSRVHVIEKICVARLLLMQDRLQADSMRLTQDVLAKQLGVRRASVSRVVTALQKNGAISYDRRGMLTITNRESLERVACSCYRSIKSDFDALVAHQGGF